MNSTPPMPPTHSSAATLRSDHLRSLTRRMLAGEGAVELTAYRAGESLSSAVHGVSRTGELVVADIPNLFHSLGAFHTAGDIEVRVDIFKDAADHALNLRLASVHLLGTLRWCRDTEEVARLGLQGRVAELVQDVGPRVRVGVISTDRVLTHDCSGITPHCSAIITEAADAPAPGDALADAVLATDAGLLAALADAVVDGAVAGWAERLQVPSVDELTVDPVHIVDVDHRCVTLARFTGDAEAWTIQVPLPPAADATGAAGWQRVVETVAARPFSALYS